jgi:tRNA(Ile)-lysidine synthase TilS/MesJ
LCNHGVIKQSVQKYRQAVRNYTDFKSNVKKADRYYDCILMLSGGKDSTYMLYKLVAEDKLRPLALTINHPYESKNAVRNIERTVEQLGVDHMMFTYNVETYKKLMNMILTKRPETYGGNLERMEKMPCMACTCYLKISSYLAAYRLQIPYILYCADPQQSASMNIDIKQIIEELIDYCGEELTNELFENQLKEILTGDPEKLPKFVFPYAVMNDYNQSR